MRDPPHMNRKRRVCASAGAHLQDNHSLCSFHRVIELTTLRFEGKTAAGTQGSDSTRSLVTPMKHERGWSSISVFDPWRSLGFPVMAELWTTFTASRSRQHLRGTTIYLRLPSDLVFPFPMSFSLNNILLSQQHPPPPAHNSDHPSDILSKWKEINFA